jgi:N-acetylglutamate synthase-like GNAT family acetyltransferase
MAATVRRLRNSDRDDIDEISRNIWEGHDYLPSVVGEWLQDPNSHFYGVEVDRHIVAVGNLRLVEGGRTGWMEGLRVHPHYRGRGFANEITRRLVEEAEKLRLARLRYTTSTQNAASVRIARNTGFSNILEMTVVWQHNITRLPKPSEYLRIQKRSPERICSLLQTKPPIVPRGILVYDWKALDCSCQNLAEIGDTHEFFIASKEGRVDSFSFGHRRQGPNSSPWSFTAYASDSAGFLSQMSHNLALALKRGLSSVACTFETRFEKALNDVNLGSEEREGTHLVLFEKRIDKER